MDEGDKERRDLSVRDATLADLEVVASWLRTVEECRLWAGPEVSFPLLPGRLAREIEFDEVEDLVLLDEAGVAGFGQLMAKPGGRAHLARVIVAPDARGRGLGHALVGALVERARREAHVASLNVHAANATALRVYQAAGFHAAPWPEDEGAATACVLHLTLDL